MRLCLTTKLFFILVVALLTCPFVTSQETRFLKFDYYRIDNIGSQLGQTALADIDICSKPWSTGNEHFYLRNMLIDGKR